MIGRDGREMKEIFVERGQLAILHYQASNVDKSLWGEDALEWKPERWLSPLPTTLDDAHVPGVYAHLSVIDSCYPYMTPTDETRACF